MDPLMRFIKLVHSLGLVIYALSAVFIYIPLGFGLRYTIFERFQADGQIRMITPIIFYFAAPVIYCVFLRLYYRVLSLYLDKANSLMPFCFRLATNGSYLSRPETQRFSVEHEHKYIFQILVHKAFKLLSI